jgi:hypothetical protein
MVIKTLPLPLHHLPPPPPPFTDLFASYSQFSSHRTSYSAELKSRWVDSCNCICICPVRKHKTVGWLSIYNSQSFFYFFIFFISSKGFHKTETLFWMLFTKRQKNCEDHQRSFKKYCFGFRTLKKYSTRYTNPWRDRSVSQWYPTVEGVRCLIVYNTAILKQGAFFTCTHLKNCMEYMHNAHAHLTSHDPFRALLVAASLIHTVLYLQIMPHLNFHDGAAKLWLGGGGGA